jgi:hypothetical protein
VATNNVTNAELAEMISELGGRIGRVEGQIGRLEVFTVGLVRKLLAPEEIAELEREADRVAATPQSTAGR